MSISRRDFMKLFGTGVASLLLTRCRPYYQSDFVSCYTQSPLEYPTSTPRPDGLNARWRARLSWLSFDELARQTLQAASQGDSSDDYFQHLVADHRQALDEMVASGDLTPAVADLVQEAYAAAVYHVWRSNAPITCYEPMVVDYAPTSAGSLVQQAQILDEIAGQCQVDPQTLATARSTIEHDLAFYALSDQDLQALYERLIQESQAQGGSIPSFGELSLELTSDVQAAALFIIALLADQ